MSLSQGVGASGAPETNVLDLVSILQRKLGYGSGGGGPGGPGGPMGPDMTEISREEVDAKLALVDAKTDAKFEALRGDIKVMLTELRHVSDTLTTVNTNVASDYKSTRNTIILTAIGSVIAIVGLLYAGMANTISAFQTGLTAVSTVHEVSPPAASPAPRSPQGTAPETQQ